MFGPFETTRDPASFWSKIVQDLGKVNPLIQAVSPEGVLQNVAEKSLNKSFSHLWTYKGNWAVERRIKHVCFKNAKIE